MNLYQLILLQMGVCLLKSHIVISHELVLNTNIFNTSYNLTTMQWLTLLSFTLKNIETT
jgi:hypothetical protein